MVPYWNVQQMIKQQVVNGVHVIIWVNQNKIPTEKDDQGKQSFKCDHPNFNSIHGSACDLIKIV